MKKFPQISQSNDPNEKAVSCDYYSNKTRLAYQKPQKTKGLDIYKSTGHSHINLEEN